MFGLGIFGILVHHVLSLLVCLIMQNLLLHHLLIVGENSSLVAGALMLPYGIGYHIFSNKCHWRLFNFEALLRCSFYLIVVLERVTHAFQNKICYLCEN